MGGKKRRNHRQKGSQAQQSALHLRRQQQVVKHATQDLLFRRAQEQLEKDIPPLLNEAISEPFNLEVHDSWYEFLERAKNLDLENYNPTMDILSEVIGDLSKLQSADQYEMAIIHGRQIKLLRYQQACIDLFSPDIPSLLINSQPLRARLKIINLCHLYS